MSDNALYTLTGTYLLLYLTTVVGLSPAIAGTISAIGSIWEAIAGPIIGFKSDATISRFGRRKPFMMVAAIPIAIVTSLLFTTIEASMGVKAIYYGLMIVLFWTFFSMEFVPYLSWGADLTEDYHERTVLRSYAYVFNQVGMLIGMVLPTIVVDYAMNLGKTTQQSWQYVGIMVGLSACTALLVSSLTIHNDDMSPEEAKKRKNSNACSSEQSEDTSAKTQIGLKGIFTEYFQIIKLKPILMLIGSSMLYLIANTVFSSDRVFFMTYNLGMSQTEVSLYMFIITITGVLFVPFITGACKNSDKKNVFMWGIGISGVLMILLRFIPVGAPALASDYVLAMFEEAGVSPKGMGPTMYCIIVCTVYSFANTCYWQLMPSMVYDICEVDELKSGQSHAGAVISLQALSESICIAIGLQGIGIALDLAKFDETIAAIPGLFGSVSSVQPDTALNWVSNMFTLIPGIFMILVFIVMLRYPINKESFKKIRLAVKRQRNGEKVDLSEFDDIF